MSEPLLSSVIPFATEMNSKTLSIIVRAQDQASKTLEKVSGNTEKATRRMEGAFSKMKSGAIAAGKAIAAAGATASVALGGMFMAAVKSTADLEQSLGGVEVVFGEFADEMKKNARESAFVMGTSMNQYLETANKMGSLFQGAGFDVKRSMKLTAESMQRATDVATAMGISTDMALESIAGAAKGNFTMMDNLGVAMNDTTLSASGLEEKLGKTVGQMTIAEKVGGAMELFMERTAKYAGNYARENETLSGSFQTLKGAWGNFLAGVEDSDVKLMQASENIARVLGERLPEIASKLISSLGSLISMGFDKLPGPVKDIAYQVGDYLIPKMERLWDTINQRLIPELSRLWRDVIEPLIPVIGAALVAAFGLFVDSLNIAIEVISWLIGAFIDVWNAAADGDPIIWGLIGVIGALSAALAIKKGIAAFSDAMTAIQMVHIPKAVSAFSGMTALMTSPIVLPALAIGAAIASIVAVKNAWNATKQAIEQERVAIQNELDASVNMMNTARARRDRGEISEEQFRSIVGIAARHRGGSAMAGQPYLVGENADGTLNSTSELFVPRVSGNIFSAKDLQSALGSGGGQTFNMYGNVLLGDASAVDRYYERFMGMTDKKQALGEYGVGI